MWILEWVQKSSDMNFWSWEWWESIGNRDSGIIWKFDIVINSPPLNFHSPTANVGGRVTDSPGEEQPEDTNDNGTDADTYTNTSTIYPLFMCGDNVSTFSSHAAMPTFTRPHQSSLSPPSHDVSPPRDNDGKEE